VASGDELGPRGLHPGVRKALFWTGVAGVSILANFGLELVSQKYPQFGLAQFTAYTHKGTS
jgi:hypothetical protein